MKKCFELKGCPVSHYMNCPAFKEGVNCWEISKGCLCHNYPDCNVCPLYEKHLNDLKAEEE